MVVQLKIQSFFVLFAKMTKSFSKYLLFHSLNFYLSGSTYFVSKQPTHFIIAVHNCHIWLYWPETGTEFPSVRVMWDPTPIKSSSSIWKQTLLLIILSMVNLLFGGVITYRTYSSQGIRMSTKFLIESSPKNMLKFRWQLFYIFKSYKLDRYLSVTSVVKFWGQ